jgi:hypothetical protein
MMRVFNAVSFGLVMAEDLERMEIYWCARSRLNWQGVALCLSRGPFRVRVNSVSREQWLDHGFVPVLCRP